jgi:hypothetical protein
MFDLWFIVIRSPQNRHHIKSRWLIKTTTLFQPRQRRASEFLLLLPIDRLERQSRSGARSRFDFDKDDATTVQRNNIHFAELISVLTIQNPHPLRFQKTDRCAFSAISQQFANQIFHGITNPCWPRIKQGDRAANPCSARSPCF